MSKHREDKYPEMGKHLDGWPSNVREVNVAVESHILEYEEIPLGKIKH